MTTKTRVAVIGTVGVPARYGGFETLTEHLIENVGNEFDLTVYCSGVAYPKHERKEFYKQAKLVYIPLKANGVQSILYDAISIIHALFFSDIFLILGVSGAFLLPFVKLFTNKKIIISIDGIEWKRDKWSFLAKAYLFWAESLAVKFSHIDISDNESIQNYTAMRYGSLSRIIEYGADHTAQVTPQSSDKKEFPFLKQPYAFNVCRIEPENNVHNILKAFAELGKYTLVIVGNWNNSVYGKSLKARYSSFKNIVLLDPIYNQKKLDVLRGNALLYLHGHSAGGTNPSLVEAMYLGLPIIAFDVSYNRVTTEDAALYFEDYEDLKELIEKTSFKEIKQVGEQMKSIAYRRYTWKIISEKYKELFMEVVTIQNKKSINAGISLIDLPELIKLNLGHLKHHHAFYE